MSKGSDVTVGEMAEVLRLTTTLSHHVLNTLLAHQPVPRDQTTALIKAAHLLEDNGVPWPPVLTQALNELADSVSGSITPSHSPQSKRAPLETVNSCAPRDGASSTLSVRSSPDHRR